MILKSGWENENSLLLALHQINTITAKQPYSAIHRKQLLILQKTEKLSIQLLSFFKVNYLHFQTK